MALDVPYRSIPDMFRQRVAATPDRAALGYPTPDAGIGWFTWAEAERRVTAIAAGLIGLGVAPEDRVAILCSTRVEWILADFGVMCAGAATTAIYPTTEPDEAVFIVRDSGSTVLIAENAEQTAKVAEADLAHVIVIDGEPDSGQLSLAELERRGAAALEQDPGLVDRVVESVRPDQLATLIYTSGTTGRPKGVELLHGGWCWEGVAQCEEGLLSDSDLHYLWLPLSHSFGKALVCGLTHGGVQTYVDGRVDRLVDNLSQVRPTLMAAPPRIYEKIYNVVVGTATADGGVKARIFEWAVHVGKRAVTLEQQGKPVPAPLAAQRAIADRLVFTKLRARLGGRTRILVSGAARRSCAATTTCPTRPPTPSPTTASSAPATSVSWTPTGICGSPTARRTSSRPRAASTWRPATSRACSSRSARTPRRCSSPARHATTARCSSRWTRTRSPSGRPAVPWKAPRTPRSSPHRPPTSSSRVTSRSSTAGRPSRSSPSCCVICPLRTVS